MKVDVLEAFFALAVLYDVGSYLLWFNKKIITWTANEVFGTFKRQGAEDERRRMEEEEEYEDEDLPAVCSECRDFKPPPVQVIDDVGKKCH